MILEALTSESALGGPGNTIDALVDAAILIGADMAYLGALPPDEAAEIGEHNETLRHHIITEIKGRILRAYSHHE